MSLLQRGLEFAQRCLPEAGGGICVLAYHLIGGTTQTVVDIPLDEFRRQLDWLVATQRVVSLDDALTAAPDGGRRVVLTFDDAYRNFLDLAWPELATRGLPAMMYIPVGFVEGSAPPPLRGAALPPLSYQELRRLLGAGLHVGSHGLTHRNLRRLSDVVLQRELAESRHRLEQELGVEITSFCYPQAKVSLRVAREASRHYRSAVSAGGRTFDRGPVMSIPRYPVRRGEPAFGAMVRSKVWLREAIAHGIRQYRA